MPGNDLEVPESWKALAISSVNGPLLIVGTADSGKSTLARYLHGCFGRQGRPAAYIDGDPGQSTVGPPATITLALSNEDDTAFPPTESRRIWFVGSSTPRGHMLPLIAGAARLLQEARRADVGPIIYDSSGLTDPDLGGAALKQALVDVLQPQLIISIQLQQELEVLLRPWRKQRGLDLVELAAAPAVRRRDSAERQAHRARRFAQHFRHARRLTLDPDRFAVIPSAAWQVGRLLALRDERGFVLALAIVQERTASGELRLWTPLPDAQAIASIQVGDLLVNPRTYRDQLIR
ncbi:MAG TPA: Clp1/GlmU family protein [Candidatus Sulfomarinibacteraceae bacterium]|nr:Clp1/GlmU family protein [Candidatus Sulfomarinibacteraceae bacterium]